MKTRWNNLPVQQKQSITIGAIIALPILIYGLIFSPLSNSVQSLRERIHKNQQILLSMQKSDEKIRALAKKEQPLTLKTSAALLSMVQQNINKTAISKTLLKLQQAENNSLELKFQNVNFDSLMEWLIALANKQNLLITQFNVKPSSEAGTVDATIKLLG